MRNSQRVVVGVIGAIAALIVATGVWLRLAASPAPQLSGERATRTYDHTGFRGVGISGQWQLTVERGDAWRVSVEAPAELVENLRIRVEGNALELGYDGRSWFGDFDGDNTLEATISMPELEALEISGTSLVRFSGFEGSTLSLDVSGAGEIRGAASRFDRLTLDASGAVNVELGDVPVADAVVDISGAGNVTLRMAGGRLTGDVAGVASLEYYGTVSEESVDTSGLTSVRRRD
jgi:hypothetical protein